MNVKYLRGKNGKRLDVRSMIELKKARHFNVQQGACSDGAYVYFILERKEHKEPKQTHRCRIVKMELSTHKIVKVSKMLNIGHGNDICIKKNVLYITHSGRKFVIHRVKADTLEILKDVKVAVSKSMKKHVTGFNAIEVYSDGFIIRCMGGNYLAVADENLKIHSYIKCTKPFASGEDSQGMTIHDGYIYRAYSKGNSKSKNYICKFDFKGKLKSKSKVKMHGELEDIFFVNNKLYGVSFRKKTVKKERKYMSYIFRITK